MDRLHRRRRAIGSHRCADADVPEISARNGKTQKGQKCGSAGQASNEQRTESQQVKIQGNCIVSRDSGDLLDMSASTQGWSARFHEAALPKIVSFSQGSRERPGRCNLGSESRLLAVIMARAGQDGVPD